MERPKSVLPRKLLKQIKENERLLNLTSVPERKRTIRKSWSRESSASLGITLNTESTQEQRQSVSNNAESDKSNVNDLLAFGYNEHLEGLHGYANTKIQQFDSTEETVVWMHFISNQEQANPESNSVDDNEYKLAAKPVNQDPLRQSLFLRYLPFAESEARKFAKKMSKAAPVTDDDCIGAACIGLMNAIDAYDPNVGTKFQVFARQRIIGAIIDQLRTLQHFPRSIPKVRRLLKPIEKRLYQELHKRPTVDEIADELRRMEAATSDPDSKEEIKDLLVALHDPLLYADVYNEGSSRAVAGVDSDEVLNALYENVIDHRGSSANNSNRANYFINLVNSVLSDEKKSLIVLGYYFMKMTNKSIGFALGISTSSVVVKRREAIAELRFKFYQCKKQLLREANDG